MRKSIKIISLVLVVILFTLIVVPKIFWRLGWAPDPIKASFDYPKLGIKIFKPNIEDKLNWVSRSKNTQDEHGIFLQMRNADKSASIDFAYAPTTPNKQVKYFLQELRTGSGCFSNMEYKNVTICGAEAIQEISDYSYQGKNLRFFSIAFNHRNNFILIETSSPQQSFDRLVDYAQKLANLIKLY